MSVCDRQHLSRLLAGSDADTRFGVRDRPQVGIDGAQVVVGHVSQDRPRHHLQNAIVFVRVVARADQVLELGERVY
jgi:hypothetical protein